MRRAVFLDRDDTLIANRSLEPVQGRRRGDLCDPARVRLLEGALEGSRLLKRARFTLVVVSNQGVVARGGGTIADVEATNRRVGELLVDERGRELIDAFYYCPYHPQGTVPEFTREHPWRKPQPGMILQAAEDLDLDLARSWMIGDGERDIEAAVAAGIPQKQCVLLGERIPTVLAAAVYVVARERWRERSSASLEAIESWALEDELVRETVRATAESIGERTGLRVDRVAFEGPRVEVTVEGTQLAAVGLVAELRRATEAWHRRRFGRSLWPSPPDDGPGSFESWPEAGG